MKYIEQRDKETLARLEKLRTELPPFCGAFFLATTETTTPLTRMNYAFDLRKFFRYMTQNSEHFLDKPLAEITEADIDQITAHDIELYTEWMRTSPATKQRRLSSLRAFFAFLFKRDMISKNVLPLVDLPKLKDKTITRLERDEVAKIIDLPHSEHELTQGQLRFTGKTALRDQTILTLFLATGVRISELVGLNLDDIDLKNSSFRIIRKGGAEAILFMPPELCDQMVEYMESLGTAKMDDTPLFKSIQGKRICVRAVQNMVKKYAKIVAPLKNISPHKLRSTFGTQLYRNTQDIYVVAEVLGHKDVNTTKKHYAAMSEEIRKKAAAGFRLREEER